MHINALHYEILSFRALLDREKLAKVIGDHSKLSPFETIVLADAIIQYFKEGK
jgi:hypothetical protein